MKNLLIVIVVIFALSRLVPSYLDNGRTPAVSEPSEIVKQYENTLNETVSQRFVCDGREYCSQMTSRAEAVYFTRHCPNTKMDGDGDGIPCESDSRW
ncbi:excalibur calcium-binding domain-containing protein [Reinekea blandensis]|uniref:Putative cold-shock DNA-binding domain n=1 Tax=Reinekea blandensis MED297 TaxID=314283 RepID=A4BHA9_9GAMM|nr:excalibur calcium-binding domain-containing protein [Reinekea blandensis]EAR08457.1 putative cold-shock DNA-binding domain [Reinekea sp. MED297] [Reinekea blandensis MED297]